MKNAGLEDSQAGIKIARRNINNLRFADDTILVAKSKEGLGSLLMRGRKVSEKAGLKLSILKMKMTPSSPITSWQIEGRKVEVVTDFFSWAPKSLQRATAALKLKDACSLEGKL